MEKLYKKLLIMGANSETIPLIQVAKDMGVYTIATDFNPHAPAKKISDKSYDVDGVDVKNIVELAKIENIDGVLVGVADLLVPYYHEVCKILNLPCYATAKATNVFSNKYKFKRACESYGINGVREFSESDIEYPVLIKPVDNCSGQGITVCQQKENLSLGINKAKKMSRSGQFIIEKYMTCDDVVLYYTFANGKYYLSATGDRKTLASKNGSPVNLGSTYPSRHTKLYLEKFHDKFEKLFNYLNIENGVLLIQAFVENNEFYVYDPGLRLQGEAPHIILNEVNGFDHRKMLVNFSLTGKMIDINFPSGNDCYLKGKIAATLWILLSTGKIQKIEGMINDDLRIIHVAQRLYEGDIVTDDMVGTEKQVLARFYLVCDTKEEMDFLSQELRRKVKVFGELGENMIISPQ